MPQPVWPHQLIERHRHALGLGQLAGVLAAPPEVDEIAAAAEIFVLTVRHRQPVVGVDVLVRGIGRDPVGLAVLVGEHQHRTGRTLAVGVECRVEFNGMLDLDESRRLGAVTAGDTAVDVKDCAVGGFDDPRLDGLVGESGIEPQPEVDLVGDPHAEGAVASTVETVDVDALPVDAHPAGPAAGLLHVVHVGQQLPVGVAHLHRQQFPHRGGGLVVQLPFDAGGVRFDIQAPLLQRLNACPAHRPGTQVGTVGTGDGPARKQVPVPAVGHAHLDIAHPGSGVGIVAVSARQQQRAVRRRGEEVAAVRPRRIRVVYVVECRRQLVGELFIGGGVRHRCPS